MRESFVWGLPCVTQACSEVPERIGARGRENHSSGRAREKSSIKRRKGVHPVKKIAIFLLASVVLLTSAVAEVSKDHYRIIGGSYTVEDGEQFELYVNLALDKSAAGKFVGHFDAFILDSRQGAIRLLNAFGIVPLSALRVTGRSISVNIGNLRDLVGPDFLLEETGFSGPIPLNCRITEATDFTNTTYLSKTHYSRVLTKRVPQPDGKVTLEKSRQNSTGFSGTAEGVIADFLMPLADAQYNVATFFKSSGVNPDLSYALVTQAAAAERPGVRKSGERLVQGAYVLQGPVSFHIVLNLTRAANGKFEGDVEFSIVDWGSRGSFRGLSATGKVPASVLKVTGRSIRLNISDLRNLVGPEFQLYEIGIPGPIPVDCTITKTDSSNTVYRDVSVDRVLQPDGAVTTYRWTRSESYASGFGSGSIADYEIPWLSDPLPDGSYTDASFHTSNDFRKVKP
jgi:hypothetical protein